MGERGGKMAKKKHDRSHAWGMGSTEKHYTQKGIYLINCRFNTIR